MNNMVPFSNAQVPAFLQQTGLTPEQVKAMNAAAATGTGGGGVNKISLKQSRFRMVVGGQEHVIPTMELDLVIVRVNEGISKTWYEKEWNPNEEAGAPECSSDDGISPRADSPKKQCGPDGLCANCPQNQWGSKINRITGEKVKACTDTKRMAIMAPGADGRYSNRESDLYQLSVPPASLKDFGGFVRGLAAMPTPAGYNMVVARIGFDPAVSYPKILFKPVRWLENDEWEAVRGLYDAEETQRVAGLASAQTMRPVGQLTQQAQPQVQPQVQPQQSWGQPTQAAPQVQPQQSWGQPTQAAPQVQQPAPQPNAGGWGQPQQAPVQQPAPEQSAGGWGQPQQAPVQQQAPAQQQAPVQRERGKPSPGKARRTKAEIEEDAAADARDAAAGVQQAPVQQAPAQQAPAQQAPVQQAPAQQPQQNWGQPQQAPVQQQAPLQTQQLDPANPWGQAPGAQPQQAPQTGAPIQPNVAGGDALSAFQGWDD